MKIAIIKNIAYFVRFKEKYSFAQVFSLFLLYNVKNLKKHLCSWFDLICINLLQIGHHCFRYTVSDIHERVFHCLVCYSTVDILDVKFQKKLSFFFQIFKQIDKLTEFTWNSFSHHEPFIIFYNSLHVKKKSLSPSCFAYINRQTIANL